MIDPTNGNIYTDCATSDLDREKLDVYYLSVTATDGKLLELIRSFISNTIHTVMGSFVVFVLNSYIDGSLYLF